MASEAPVPVSDDVDVVTEKPITRRSSLQSKNKLGKVPRKIHKAEREKRKRDSLNVLFLRLSNALEPAHQNNGKASVLINTTRLLRDLLAQVDCLKKENATLLSESQYVTTEKHELREETSALQTQIENLKSEVQKRMHSKYAWKLDHLQSQHDIASQRSDEDHLVMPVTDHALLQPAPILGPVLVVPLNHHDGLAVYHESDTSDSVAKPPANVSRPHARYPSSSDSWPSQILAHQPETPRIVQYASSGAFRRED